LFKLQEMKWKGERIFVDLFLFDLASRKREAWKYCSFN